VTLPRPRWPAFPHSPFLREAPSPAGLGTFLLPLALFGQGLSLSSTKLIIESGTPVDLQQAQTISSGHAHMTDRLQFVVDKDVEIGGFTVISAGARAEGSVARVKGKRPLGIGGDVIIKLDSVELTTGEKEQLTARKEFRGRSRTIRMAVGMAVTAVIDLPAAPAFLLAPGRDSTALKGTEVTAYTKGDFSADTRDLPVAQGNISDLSEMIKLLPPRVLNGKGREGDMVNLIFAAKEEDLEAAFAHAGWVKVEKSTPQIIWHLLQEKNTTRSCRWLSSTFLEGRRTIPTPCLTPCLSSRVGTFYESGKQIGRSMASLFGSVLQRTMSLFNL
jgi:LssY C-terminus